MEESSDPDDIVPDSERRGLIGVLPGAARPFASLIRLDRPIGAWLLFWPGAWAVALAGGRAGRSRIGAGSSSPGSRSAPGRCAALAASITTSSIATSTARSSGRNCGRWRRPGVVEGRLGPARGDEPDRPRRPASAGPHRPNPCPRQPAAGRGLSFAADHLVAPGLARHRLFLGRPGRLAGRHRHDRASGAVPLCGRDPVGDRLRHRLRCRTARTTRWSASDRRRGRSGGTHGDRVCTAWPCCSGRPPSARSGGRISPCSACCRWRSISSGRWRR